MGIESKRNLRKKKRRAKRIRRNIFRGIVLIFIIIGVFAFIKRENIMRMNYQLKYDKYVQKYSREYDIDPLLIHSVIHIESDHNPKAVSNRGAIGLMQIMEETGYWISQKKDMKDFDKQMLFNPEDNINMGTWLLTYLIKEYDGNEDTALAAYNAGIGNVNEWLNTNEYSSDGIILDYIPFKETSDYVKKVKSTYKRYKELY
ncbi:MAG: lytic transglycosylase domain-containing protein [Andreesenia angusta]|nr:lytic transglycosylase domain-containing protein [Andreesenia angusta]